MQDSNKHRQCHGRLVSGLLACKIPQATDGASVPSPTLRFNVGYSLVGMLFIKDLEDGK